MGSTGFMTGPPKILRSARILAACGGSRKAVGRDPRRIAGETPALHGKLFRTRYGFTSSSYNSFCREAEVFLQILPRSRSAERVHADHLTLRAHVTFPAKRCPQFFQGAGSLWRRQHTVFVSLILFLKDFPRGHAD